MALAHDEVLRLAELARLDLTAEAQEKMSLELGRILEYVDRLAKIDTTGVPETEADGIVAAWRSDEVSSADPVTRELILANFPDRVGDLLRVPAVFENPKG